MLYQTTSPSFIWLIQDTNYLVEFLGFLKKEK